MRKTYLKIVVILLSVLIVGTAFVSAGTENKPKKNLGIKNIERAQEKLTKTITSERFNQSFNRLYSMFNEEEKLILENLSYNFMSKTPIPQFTERFLLIKNFVMWVLMFSIIFFGHNDLTMLTAIGVTGIITIPFCAIASFGLSFFVALPLAWGIMISLFPNLADITNIIYEFGVLGSLVYMTCIFPVLIGILCVVYILIIPEVTFNLFFQLIQEIYTDAEEMINGWSGNANSLIFDTFNGFKERHNLA